MIHVLYNPYAGNHQGKIRARRLTDIYAGKKIQYIDMTKIDDYPALLRSLAPDDELVLCGGDGTLNRFVNDMETAEIHRSILYYPVGSGNDFGARPGHAGGGQAF